MINATAWATGHSFKIQENSATIPAMLIISLLAG